MIQLRDQIGQILELTTSPKRIVSLVPSQTELLVSIGLENLLVGVTKFCVHPKRLLKEKTIVGGTKSVHLDKISQLKPDIILCNKEENTKEMVEALKAIAAVHTSDVISLQDHDQLIEQYGILFERQQAAKELLALIHQNVIALQDAVADLPIKKVAYLIWKKPYMAAGKDTFINTLLELCGFKNAIQGLDGRYPEVTPEHFKQLDYLLLSSEPYPFKLSDGHELEKHTNARVKLVDGEYFSWYGSRLVEACRYFIQLRKELEL